MLYIVLLFKIFGEGDPRVRQPGGAGVSHAAGPRDHDGFAGLLCFSVCLLPECFILSLLLFGGIFDGRGGGGRK